MSKKVGGIFVIMQKLPSLNEVIQKNRANRYAAAKQKTDLQSQIGAYIQSAVGKGTLAAMGERPCIIKITWMEQNKRRDVDNIQSAQKFILDALQTYGILQNDSQKYVRQIFHTIMPAEKTQVIVELIPCQMAVVNGVVM